VIRITESLWSSGYFIVKKLKWSNCMSSQNWNDINSPSGFVSSSPQKEHEPIAEEIALTREPAIVNPPAKTRVLRARFISDQETDFNKNCKVLIDVDGPENLQVNFALWAKYNGQEYDLQKEKTGRIRSGVVEGELPLYFVDDFYSDYFLRAKATATVDYFVKVQIGGMSEFSGEPMIMPLKHNDYTIQFMRQVSGQDQPAANDRCVIEIELKE
jgi:hypothetical protein